jgi:dihydroneopterin aldolase/2-amino-4-hydroxy-6-hydroxymethyldihydropteridine diphosphokinase
MNKYDEIHIDNLEMFANHGVFPEENKLGQKFIINAVLYTNTRTAGLSDDLSKSIDYGKVCHLINAFVKGNTFNLIETLTEKLAEKMLNEIPHLEAVDLEIRKPWAPVGLPLESVSVKISRSWHKAYIAIGSNIGNKQGYLDTAVKEIDNLDYTRVIKTSSFIETEPYGVTDQDRFLNGAIVVKTLYTPHELLDKLHEIEDKNGRTRELRWGPRTLDLDIIFYDELVYSDKDLIIPHVDMHNRDFVIKPLMEIAPYYRHPVFNKTIMELDKEL